MVWSIFWGRLTVFGNDAALVVNNTFHKFDRDTGSIEEHVDALVSLWESCLHHNLKILHRDEDAPHAKIASDIMSCLFMVSFPVMGQRLLDPVQN